MNVETGKITEFDENERLQRRVIPIKRKDMTAKQKELLQVSKFDNKSVLGKTFRDLRVKRKKANLMRKKSRKINRRK